MNPTGNTAIDGTAAYLAELRFEGRRVEALPQSLMPPDLASGYAVQAALVRLLLERWGGTAAGYKIALTNPAAQAMLGVPHPVFGRLLSARIYHSGVKLPAHDYAVRVIECEIGLRIGKSIPNNSKPYDAKSIAPFVAGVLPCIELVEHHFAALDRVNPQSLAADNAIHGAWIHGTEISNWTGIDLADQQTGLEVNGRMQLSGHSAKVLGHPLNALAWLANTLPNYGLGLTEGDFVTTGITTDAIYDAVQGDRLTASLGKIGQVALEFV